MAGLRVFVSSTCVDLGAQRTQVRMLLEKMGYEPIMSEYSDVLFDHRLHTHSSCVKEIVNADIVILLIGSRFGGTAIPEALSESEIKEISKSSNSPEFISESNKLSITQVEILKAIEFDVPMFAFVDSKVYSDHHLYQINKEKDFSDDIIYPSIEKPNTAKYIFEFINFITHRFSNNAITPYSGFSDIEDHLIKQWSMTFQRLLREERDKSIEGRRADAMLEQIQDLKAAVLQSISAGSGRNIARSVLRYRRLADFLLEMRMFNSNINLATFQGSFEELMSEFGVVNIVYHNNNRNSGMMARAALILSDGTHVRVRIPDRRFMQFAVEWKTFSKLDKDTKEAVLDGVEDSENSGPSIVVHLQDPFNIEENISPDANLRSSAWTPQLDKPFFSDGLMIRIIELAEKGLSPKMISKELGGISTNLIISEANRFGIKLSNSQDEE